MAQLAAATPTFSLRLDLGYLGPAVRIAPTISYWSSDFKRSELGRLADNATLESAQRELETLQPRFREMEPDLPATFFEQAMQGQGGAVSIVYDLWFWARLPPMRTGAMITGIANGSSTRIRL